MIFAETERLTLRALGRDELPRLVALLDVWDVVRWLVSLPFPYTMREAEALYAHVQAPYARGEPEFFVMSFKDDPRMIGIASLHESRNDTRVEGELELGYWLGKDYWGQGLMGEAVCAVVDWGFTRLTTGVIGATTAPGNQPSQGVLRRAGLRNLGVFPRPYPALRGSDEVIKWQLTRGEWEERKLFLR